MTLDDAPDVLTVPEAARLARVGRNAMYQAVARGEIYSARIGRSIRIPKVALRRFLGVDAPGDRTSMTADADRPYAPRDGLPLGGSGVRVPAAADPIADLVSGAEARIDEAFSALGLRRP